MYRCEYFFIRELVAPGMFEKMGEKCWELFDERALISLDRIRHRFGPTVVNNWHNGGDREWSGLRTPDSRYYSPTSQHSFGRAFDCIFLDTQPWKVINTIMKNPDDTDFEFINAVEDVEGWLHFDVRNCKRIKFFKP